MPQLLELTVFVLIPHAPSGAAPTNHRWAVLTRAAHTDTGSVAKFDFWGKIQKSGVRNSMTYRLTNSRKSNFATEPYKLLEIERLGLSQTNTIGY
jgi:hypothetical protein